MINNLTLGIDVGSTTVKFVLCEDQKIIYKTYERHLSKVREKTSEILEEVSGIIGDRSFSVAISGSAGLGIANAMKVPFIQEVIAEGEVINRKAPETSCVIELGGEDAKIIFLDGGADERMNGTCDLMIKTYSEKRGGYLVRYLPYEETCEFIGKYLREGM